MTKKNVLFQKNASIDEMNALISEMTTEREKVPYTEWKYYREGNEIKITCSKNAYRVWLSTLVKCALYLNKVENKNLFNIETEEVYNDDGSRKVKTITKKDGTTVEKEVTAIHVLVDKANKTDVDNLMENLTRLMIKNLEESKKEQ